MLRRLAFQFETRVVVVFAIHVTTCIVALLERLPDLVVVCVHGLVGRLLARLSSCVENLFA